MRLHPALLLVPGVLAAGAGLADNPPAPTGQTEQVVVTAQRLAVQNLVDRKVYSIEADLQSITGTVSDVLAQIPSVQLDIDGNVSLRGDGNVLVLIDGQPSAQLQGSSLGDILAQMPASDIARIEVITNPPAQYQADGTAGIINIITRRARTAGTSGTLQANVGNHDRWSTSAAGTYKAGPWALSGNLGVRMDERIRAMSDQRESTDPVSGVVTSLLRTQHEMIRRLLPAAKVSAEWSASEHDRLKLALSRSQRFGRGRYFNEDDESSVAGARVAETTRDSQGSEHAVDHGETLTFEHTTDRKDEMLSASIGQTHFSEHEYYVYENASLLPLTSLPGDGYGFANEFRKRLGNLDYTRPLAAHRSLKAGLAVEDNRNVYDNSGELQSATGTWLDNPLLDNHFVYHQTITSGYGSLQTEWSGWTSLLGLRVENSQVDISSFDAGAPPPKSDTKAFPSLHLEHAVGENGTVSFNVGRRIYRPDPEALDPHVNREDIHNLRVGNPALQAQTNQLIEVGYSFEGHDHSVGLTGYYRHIHNAYTELVQVIDASTELITRANIDHAQSGGLEFTANGRLLSKLTYNLSGNLNEYSIDMPGVPSRTGTSLSSKVSFDYKPVATDTWQLAYANWGRRVTPQGSFVPVGAVNVGFRHQIKPTLSGVVTVADVFNTQAWRRYTTTPLLNEVYERRPLGRMFFVGVVYQFGGTGKKPKRDTFDYDSSN